MTTVVLMGTVSLADYHDVHEGMIDFLNNFNADIIIHGSKVAQAKYESYLPKAIFESIETEMAVAEEGDILITSQVAMVKEAIEKGYIVLFKGDNYKLAVDRLKVDYTTKIGLKRLVSTKFRRGKVTVANSIPAIMMSLKTGRSDMAEEKENVREKVRNKEDMIAAKGKVA